MLRRQPDKRPSPPVCAGLGHEFKRSLLSPLLTSPPVSPPLLFTLSSPLLALVLAGMNAKVNPMEMQRILQEFEKQSSIMDEKQVGCFNHLVDEKQLGCCQKACCKTAWLLPNGLLQNSLAGALWLLSWLLRCDP